MAEVIRIDRRSTEIHVTRAALSAASENALAGSRMAQDAIDRAIDHLCNGQNEAALHQLGRIAFELQGRMAALRELTQLAEEATPCRVAAAA